LPILRYGVLLFLFAESLSFSQSFVSVVDTVYSAPSTPFNGSITALNRNTGKTVHFVVMNGLVVINLPPGHYRATYLGGGEPCTESWLVPSKARSSVSLFQLRGHLSQCGGVTTASDGLNSYRNAQGRLVPIPHVLSPTAYHSVLDAGAVADGIMRSDGVMTAGSAVLTSPSGSLSAKDVGKYIQVIGAGAGGTTHSDGAMTVGLDILTSASGTFTAQDVGRWIVVTGAGPKGANLLAQISAYKSPNLVELGNLSGTVMVPANAGATVKGKTYYYGYMTLEATIVSYQSATQVTLSQLASGTISSAVYAYGTNNTAHFQAELDALGAAGGGVVHVPAPASCPSGATCGYVTAATDMATATNVGAIKIRYNNLSLVGDSPQTNLFCRGAWSLVNSAVVRGYCVTVGDGGGPNGAAGEAVSNILVSNLHLWGMTNGNTYNENFPASVTTGDGWDLTNKGIFFFHDVPHDNIAITNNIIQDFKGEVIWGGGLGFTTLLIQGNTIKNFNGDAISVSVDSLQVLNNTIANGYSGVENGIFQATMTKQIFQGNHISLMRGSAITIVSEDTTTKKGNVQIIDNTFDTIAQIIPTSPAQAIYIALGSGLSPMANVSIERNICHDCWGFIMPIPGPNLLLLSNVMTIDAYNGGSFFIFPTEMANATVESNRSYLTANARKNGKTLTYIYVLTLLAQANSLSWTNNVFLNNSWQVNGTAYYIFSTTSGAGFAGLKDKNVIWRSDSCTGCAARQSADQGGQVITNGGTIEPYGPLVMLFSGVGKPKMTIDASKEQDGSELIVQNSGNVAVEFSADQNMQLVTPITLAVGASTKFRFSGYDSKWHLVSP